MNHCLRKYLSFVSLCLIIALQASASEDNTRLGVCTDEPMILPNTQTTLSFRFTKKNIEFSSLLILKPSVNNDSLHVVYLSQFGFSLLQMTYASENWTIQYQQKLLDQPGLVSILQSTIESMISSPVVLQQKPGTKCKIRLGHQKYRVFDDSSAYYLKSRGLFIRKHTIDISDKMITFKYPRLNIHIIYQKIQPE